MQIQNRTARPTTSACRWKNIYIDTSDNRFCAGRRPEPLPRLFPLSQRHRLQPGDLCLRLVVSARNVTDHRADPLLSLFRFNVDCEASAGLYGGAEGAFGSSSGGGSDGSDAGECPAPSAGADCAGAVSNCWSPGQRDTGAPRLS